MDTHRYTNIFADAHAKVFTDAHTKVFTDAHSYSKYFFTDA